MSEKVLVMTTERGDLLPGDNIRGVSVLEILGSGSRRKVKLLCKCGAMFFRAHAQVRKAQIAAVEVACKKCIRARSKQSSTLWRRAK